MTGKKIDTTYVSLLLENQKEFLDSQVKLVEVLTGIKDAICTINDNNVLHLEKENVVDSSITKLATAVEARSRVMNTVFLLLAIAIVILAGAEKALKFIAPFVAQ